MKVINAKNRRCLIISDTHCPYQHIDWLKFLRAIKEKYLDPNSLIIHIGDEIDNHAISMYPSDQDLYSAGDELEKASSCMQALEELFPKLYLLESNHGSLAFRRFKLNGIPLKYLKPLHQVYGVSSKWTWHDDIILKTKIGDVYLCHGKSGRSGALTKDLGTSSIQGHYHSKFEVTWHHSIIKTNFSVYVGCLISWKNMAFHYGKNHMKKPILGVGELSKEGYPRLLKMNLNDKDRWDGKLP